MESAGRKMKQMGRQIESSMGNFKHMMSSVSLVGDAKHFQEGKMTKFAEIRKQLESKKEKDKLNAMKSLIALITLGRDVSDVFAHVVKNVVAESMEVKKLVYMYVIHYAASNSDLALLAISSFQKDMASPNPLVRAKALHAMASMRVPSVAHLIIIALKNCIKDSSPYVRRTAAHVLPPVFHLDSKFRPDLIAMLTTLLKDSNVYVLGGALYAFNVLCPTNFDLIHANYRKICHLLADMDEWGQSMALTILLRYCRNQFKSPFITDGNDDDDNNNNNNNEDDDDEKKDENNDSEEDDFLGKKNNLNDDLLDDVSELDDDHRLLISSAKNLIHSQNANVILSVVALLFYCAPAQECADSIQALVLFVHSRREIAYVLLTNICTMAASRPELFQGFYKDFYIKSIEAGFLKELKLDILSKIAAESNIQPILREFMSYAKDQDVKFRCSTIEAMGRCASMIPDVAEKTMLSLMTLVSDSCPEVVAASVVVIRQIIQRDPSKYERTMQKLLRLLLKTNVPAARCAIVWIVGEYRQYIAGYAPDALRILAKTFIKESDEVKMQILNLAVKVYLADPQKVIKLFKYILDLCKYDQNYDLRDRARLIRVVFFLKKKKNTENSNRKKSKLERQLKPKNPEVQRKIRKAMQEMFLSKKSIPEISSPFKDRDRFVMNTLSHMVVHCAADNYIALEDFPAIPPDTSALREVADPSGGRFGSKSGDGHRGGNNSNTSNSSESSVFWTRDDGKVDEYTSNDDSDSDSDDDSDSSSGSDSDSDDSDDSGSSYSGSSSDSDDESGSDDDDDDSGSESDSDSGDSDDDDVSEDEFSEEEDALPIKVKKKKTPTPAATKNVSKKTKKKPVQDESEESVEESEEDTESESKEESSSDELDGVILADTTSLTVGAGIKKKQKINKKNNGDDSDDDLSDSDDSGGKKGSKKKQKKTKKSKKKRKSKGKSASASPAKDAEDDEPAAQSAAVADDAAPDLLYFLSFGDGNSNNNAAKANPSENIMDADIMDANTETTAAASAITVADAPVVAVSTAMADGATGVAAAANASSLESKTVAAVGDSATAALDMFSDMFNEPSPASNKQKKKKASAVDEEDDDDDEEDDFSSSEPKAAPPKSKKKPPKKLTKKEKRKLKREAKKEAKRLKKAAKTKKKNTKKQTKKKADDSDEEDEDAEQSSEMDDFGDSDEDAASKPKQIAVPQPQQSRNNDLMMDPLSTTGDTPVVAATTGNNNNNNRKSGGKSLPEQPLADVFGSLMPADTNTASAATTAGTGSVNNNKNNNHASQASASKVVNNTNNNTPSMDDILFGASASSLMSKPVADIGYIGELLNHTHSQGLQIDYEFMRSASRAGKRHNLIRLRCTNKWNTKMKGISFAPNSLDKETQQYVNIEHEVINVIAPNEERCEFIHIQFGAVSEMRFDIHVQSGTNRSKYTSKIKATPGELMAPAVNMTIDEFVKKQKKMTGMVERYITSNLKNIETATKYILKAFNLAPLNTAITLDVDLQYERFFAGKLLKDDSDVLIRLTKDRENESISCDVNCSEFMLIDQLNDVAKKCLNP